MFDFNDDGDDSSDKTDGSTLPLLPTITHHLGVSVMCRRESAG